MGIAEKQLGQLRPANTTAASIYSPGASTVASIQTLSVCNTSGSGAKFRAFHDDDGTTYDETTALFWDVTVPADSTTQVDVFAAMDDQTGNFAVRTDTADALTFTLYGAEIT